MTAAERKASGGVQQCGTRCNGCYSKSLRPERKTWKLQHLIEEAEFLFDGGADQWSIARRLGLKYDSFVRQYRRAKRLGLTNRELTYEKETRERHRRIL